MDYQTLIHYGILAVAFGIIIIVGGGLLAFNVIRGQIAKEFVLKDYCNECVQKMKDSYHYDINQKYDKLQEQIEQNRAERQAELKKISEISVRLETKVNMIFEGITKTKI